MSVARSFQSTPSSRFPSCTTTRQSDLVFTLRLWFSVTPNKTLPHLIHVSLFWSLWTVSWITALCFWPLWAILRQLLKTIGVKLGIIPMHLGHYSWVCVVVVTRNLTFEESDNMQFKIPHLRRRTIFQSHSRFEEWLWMQPHAPYQWLLLLCLLKLNESKAHFNKTILHAGSSIQVWLLADTLKRSRINSRPSLSASLQPNRNYVFLISSCIEHVGR